MLALSSFRPVTPPLKVPPAPIAHVAAVALALKFPLDWAKAGPAAIATIKAAALKHDANFLIVFVLVILSSRFVSLAVRIRFIRAYVNSPSLDKRVGW